MAKKNSNVRQRTHDRIDRFMDKAESLSESGREKMDNFRERAAMMREDADDRIRRNPEKSMLMAVSAGVLIGAILTTKMMRRH